MLVSRLAVACPLISTLVRSSGIECMALKGSEAAAGLFALPLAPGFPRAAEEALWCGAPGADEERADGPVAVLAVGTWTIPRGGGLERKRSKAGGRDWVGETLNGGAGLDCRHRMGGGEEEEGLRRCTDTPGSRERVLRHSMGRRLEGGKCGGS